MSMADADNITAIEVPLDEFGNPVISELSVAEAGKRASKNMAALWHSNTMTNAALINHYGIGSVAQYYIKRTSWKTVFKEFIPRYYYAFLNILRELKARRKADSRKKILICGIGPSLLENCLAVKQAQKEGWKIMAVDRARPQLLNQWGIAPDFTVALDGQIHVSKWFDDLRESETVFLATQTHPKVVQKVFNSKASLSMFDNRGRSDYADLIKDTIGSKFMVTFGHAIVMPTAIDIALNMGYTTVATIGTELGWEKEEDIEAFYRKAAFQTDNKHWTIKQFETAAVGFQMIAQTLQAANERWKNEKGYKPRNFIDCSGGIDKGYPYVPIDEVLKKY